MYKFAISLALIFLSAGAWAETIEREIYIDHVWTQAGTLAGFDPVEPFTQCLGGGMYIDLSTEGGSALLLLILTAKAADQKITSVTFRQNSGGGCEAYEMAL